MNRFFVEERQIVQEKIHLTNKEEIHHLIKVLRAKIGDKVEVSNGNQIEYLCQVYQIDSNQVELEVIEKRQVKRELPIDIEIFQGMPKQGKLEGIVQKSVELGVHFITPVFMQRSVVTKSEKDEKKIERLNGIALSAAKQSKRGFVPIVKMPINFNEAVERLCDKSLIIFPYEGAETINLKTLLKRKNINDSTTKENVSNKEAEKIKSIGIIIGPEGGFSKEEVDILVEAGATPVSLGPRILRTETASVYTLSIVGYELGL